MSECNIYAGFRGPQVPGVTLAETLWADLEAVFGIGGRRPWPRRHTQSHGQALVGEVA